MNALAMLLALGAVVASFVLTGVVRRLALRADLLDRPNERSSHTVPTPRGGGLAIVLATLAGLVIAWIAGEVPGALVLALAAPGLTVAAIGFADDRRPVPARLRFAVHVDPMRERGRRERQEGDEDDATRHGLGTCSR